MATNKDPGEGYRWLNEGEPMLGSDEIMMNGEHSLGTISRVGWEGHEWQDNVHWPTRRKILEFLDGF